MGNRIAELREKRGLRQDQLAEKIGTTKSQLGKLERGERRLSDHWMRLIAPVLGVQPYELLLPEGSAAPVRRIPLVGRIRCGDWREAIETPDGMVIAPDEVGPNAFALRPEGDSMDMIIQSESGYLVIDPDQKDLIDGKIYAVMNAEQETTVKEYRSNPARLVPRSSNSAHQEIIVGSDDFKVIGRAVCKVDPM